MDIYAATAFGAFGAWVYNLARVWHDAYRFTNAENEVREQFDLDPRPTKYNEYPEGYAEALEERLTSIPFPSWLTKRSLPNYIKETHAKTRTRPIDSPSGL